MSPGHWSVCIRRRLEGWTYEEDDEDDRVLVGSQAKVDIHSSNLCVADVCTIHVGQQVHYPYRWQQVQINLPYELLLFRGELLGVHRQLLDVLLLVLDGGLLERWVTHDDLGAFDRQIEDVEESIDV